jgi:DNA-binding MarR family transcriptional regulator
MAVNSLEAHLGYWLRFASNHVSHAFSLKLAGRDVTVAEWVILRELYECDAARPSELAARLGLTRGAISKLADRLIDKSLATRSSSTGDRRCQSLALTAAGSNLVPALSALADENDVEFFGHLAPSERDLLEGLMKDIVRRRGLRTVPIT